MSSTRHTFRQRHTTEPVRRSHGAFSVDPNMVVGSSSSPTGPTEVANTVQSSAEQMPAQQIGEGAIGEHNIQELAITETKIADDSISTPKLQANSVETNNIAAGAVTTEKITLADEFGATQLTPSGFVGSWEDYHLTSLKNGSFGDNADADPAGWGRTVDIPYWTTDVNASVGAPYFSAVEGSAIYHFDAVGDILTLRSDMIRVRNGIRLATFFRGHVEGNGAGTDQVTIRMEVRERDAAGSVVDAYQVGSVTMLDLDPAGTFITGSFVPQSPYVDIALRVECLAASGVAQVQFDLEEMGVFPFEVPHGTTVPDLFPAAGARFFHDTLQMWFRHDGTRWLSEQVFRLMIENHTPVTMSWSATTNSVLRAPMPYPYGSDIYLEYMRVTEFVNSGGTALSASHKWVGTIEKRDVSNVGTTIDQFIIDSGASSQWRTETLPVGALLDTDNYFEVAVNVAKTGTPGSLFAYVELVYRVAL